MVHNLRFSRKMQVGTFLRLILETVWHLSVYDAHGSPAKLRYAKHSRIDAINLPNSIPSDATNAVRLNQMDVAQLNFNQAVNRIGKAMPSKEG